MSTRRLAAESEKYSGRRSNSELEMKFRQVVRAAAIALLGCGAFGFAGCHSDDESDSCQSCSGASNAGGGGGATSGSGGSTATGGTDGSGGRAAPGEPNSPVCEPMLQAVDTSVPTRVVGSGTPASCSSAALIEAAELGGIVAFNCGPASHTIVLERGIQVPTTLDTVVDGGGKIELDGGGLHRHFTFESSGWQTNQHRLVLQNITLRNGRAPLGEYSPPLSEQPECAYGYKEGSGGAVFIRDGVLEVINSRFFDNEAALVGPDVGGGAVYALGVSSVVISGSVFKGNRAANGGAVGLLFANPIIENTIFEDNTAEGVGQNTAGHDGCPDFGHPGQGGAGGLAGAVYFDGMNADDFVFTICGSVFRNNRANELAGALFRTPNVSVREMLIDRSTFARNTARMGGVSFIKQNDVVVRASSFLHNRSGLLVDGSEVGGPLGGLWVNEGTLDLTDSTFFDNVPDGLTVEGTGTIRNVTFYQSDVNGDLEFSNSLFVETECSTASDGGSNIVWPEEGTCSTNAMVSNPLLAEPADNGGPTPTCLPNRDVVDDRGASCTSTDQRGVKRASSCTLGALEL